MTQSHPPFYYGNKFIPFCSVVYEILNFLSVNIWFTLLKKEHCQEIPAVWIKSSWLRKHWQFKEFQMFFHEKKKTSVTFEERREAYLNSVALGATELLWSTSALSGIRNPAMFIRSRIIWPLMLMSSWELECKLKTWEKLR